ncbi:tRNA (guanosine-2'-O-)-methyltransferase [Pseudidiomarina planktonica]|uniref:tRNA (guanosine(18)-2'-O)-methyltransferase n=1 Tax=Pseudidiomarina planktonica TaxID=1323738 RepID=A0A1Y6FWC5_9GAMM|nr:tRNA (guanosine(18)-2'-O)-methyltransferase TrmH [Pseudidiomarina planktonica]RUO63902.1 tRNA (guanosine(18)-2'-O)-methyltransferase TrmH [Pseudidiomarina planktonica]SMQ80023.1 tRNA (guanosine-2'-O-)-methyltransferase [Pseudidiomarina planktonica]
MSPERFARINALLDTRQPDLTLCLEGVHKNHNLSAVVRTADAVGVHEMHAVWFDRKGRVAGGTAMGSQNWVRVHHHQEPTSTNTLRDLQAQGMQVLVTHLSDTAIDFREVDYTRPTCIVMGQEKHGVSAESIAAADHQIVIPMVGMAQSLNVSVAAAVVLYEAQRQRELAGMYAAPRLSAAERHRVLFEGGHPIFAKLCRQKNIPYPELDEQGQIMADEAWWQQIRLAQK